MTLSDLIGAIDAVVRKRLSPALNETARGDCIWFRGATTTPAEPRFTLMMIRRLYRIERKVPYQAAALPDLHRPARPVVFWLPHQSTHHFRSELARSRVVRQFHAGRVVLQDSKAGVTENKDITRH